MRKTVAVFTVLGTILVGFGSVPPATADGGVTFTDIAADGGAGITYQRAGTPERLADREEAIASLPVPFSDFFTITIPNYAMKPWGVPGVALLDYDGDGDLDIYVTNGPDTPNSLYSNQLVESGELTFVDVAVEAGVDATSMDSTGVCFGDLDNDGDEDIYVVGTGDPYQLFENNGDGTFTDVSDAVTGQARHASGCTMVDVNNDGLLDIYVANSYDDWLHRKPSTTPGPTYPGLEQNFLFLNQGDLVFEDISGTSGIENVSNMDYPGLNGGAQSYAVGGVDFDQDGDADLFTADNQGGIPQVVDGVVQQDQRRGWLRVMRNEGVASAQFSDVTVEMGLDVEGGWMGFAFGDYNCDGWVDFFCSNLGTYLASASAISSFYYYDGTKFNFGGPDTGNGFGWGASPLDYDNDGDLDVVYHGSVERLNFIGADNPGILIQNQGVCSGTWDYDINAWTVDHNKRNVQGVAVGDLNDDGFTDIVTASAVNFVPDMNYLPFNPQGSTLDPLMARQFFLFNFPALGGFVLLNDEFEFQPGNLVVEINNAENQNNWLKVKVRGSIGTLNNGTVNRDGIGAQVKFTPDSGPSVTRAVVGGSSHVSEDALELGFGLGSQNRGDLEVLWPGGVRNRLLSARKGERVLLPEIPCSIDSDLSYKEYSFCVTRALTGLLRKGVIPATAMGRIFLSAILSYLDQKRYEEPPISPQLPASNPTR